MDLWIETGALKGTGNNLLWSGALYGLKRLQQLDHHISFSVQELSENQKELLQNEGIDSSSALTSSEADILVTSKSGQLVTKQQGKKLNTFENWIQLSDAICFPQRRASHRRTTSETEISVELNLDGTGKSDIETGLGFLDHMLDQISKHGLIDLKLKCNGDLEVDEHHTIEDVAIALGETITKALGNKMGIQRYSFALPMDESRATVVMDLSGRPYLVFEGSFNRDTVGDFPTEMTEHFFYSLAMNLKATIHIEVQGKNDHHKIEAIFKSFARCLRASVSRSERNLNILPSTKDLL